MWAGRESPSEKAKAASLEAADELSAEIRRRMYDLPASDCERLLRTDPVRPWLSTAPELDRMRVLKSVELKRDLESGRLSPSWTQYSEKLLRFSLLDDFAISIDKPIGPKYLDNDKDTRIDE